MSLDNNEWHFIFSFFVHHRNTLNFWIQTIFGDVYLSDSVGLIMIITMRWELYTQQLHLHIYRMHAQKNAFSSVFFLFSFSNDKWRRKRITSSKSKLNLNISLKKCSALVKYECKRWNDEHGWRWVSKRKIAKCDSFGGFYLRANDSSGVTKLKSKGLFSQIRFTMCALVVARVHWPEPIWKRTKKIWQTNLIFNWHNKNAVKRTKRFDLDLHRVYF